MSVLNSVAKVVLGDRFEEFARRHAQFVSDKSSVIEDDDFAALSSINSSVGIILQRN
jgi:hypothetical protein